MQLFLSTTVPEIIQMDFPTNCDSTKSDHQITKTQYRATLVVHFIVIESQQATVNLHASFVAGNTISRATSRHEAIR